MMPAVRAQVVGGNVGDRAGPLSNGVHVEAAGLSERYRGYGLGWKSVRGGDG